MSWLNAFFVLNSRFDSMRIISLQIFEIKHVSELKLTGSKSYNSLNLILTIDIG